MVDKLVFRKKCRLGCIGCRHDHFENQTVLVCGYNNVSFFSFDIKINVIFSVKVGTV
jgi:hypothetical protein